MSKMSKQVEKRLDGDFINANGWLKIVRNADEGTLIFVRDYVFKRSKYRRDDWISLADQKEIKIAIEDRFLDI